MSAENKALLRKWFAEVWNEGRVESIDALMAPDAVVHSATGDLHGPEAFKAFQAAYRNAFPDVRVELEAIVAEGDLVAARWRATCTHCGDGLGFPATNKAVQFSGMVFARIENGQFAEGWDIFDQLGMLQQMGVAPAPGVQT